MQEHLIRYMYSVHVHVLVLGMGFVEVKLFKPLKKFVDMFPKCIKFS